VEIEVDYYNKNKVASNLLEKLYIKYYYRDKYYYNYLSSFYFIIFNSKYYILIIK